MNFSDYIEIKSFNLFEPQAKLDLITNIRNLRLANIENDKIKKQARKGVTKTKIKNKLKNKRDKDISKIINDLNNDQLIALIKKMEAMQDA